MNGKIILDPAMFSRDEKVLFENDTFKVIVFKYSTGVEAITLKNGKGFITMLPYMGQMIWDMEFLGHNMVMKSIYDEPEVCSYSYGESYGCFMMHCGLTAMGNPTEEDTHIPHGELPIAKYKEAYILFGEDEKGKYRALGGIYSHKRAFQLNYDFVPECRLYEDASTVDITVNFTNNKDLPLEYFYLCHINYRPIDGSKLIYTAKPENVCPHMEVPEGYPEAEKTKAYVERLQKDSTIMNTVNSATQSYAPEIVFTCKYDSDEDGNAHTMQLLPDGYSCYVCHRPEELPFGVRWIARTKDEDSLGMVLPATAEHKGYLYCKAHGYEKYLESGKTVTYHMTTGILSPADSESMKNKIENILK